MTKTCFACGNYYNNYSSFCEACIRYMRDRLKIQVPEPPRSYLHPDEVTDGYIIPTNTRVIVA